MEDLELKDGETFWIKAYWTDTKESFTAKCEIGVDINEDDDIFFYFRHEKEVKEFMSGKEGVSEFCITEYYR